MAPPRTVPNHASNASGEFSISVATLAPGVTPMPARPAASRSARSPTSPADSLVPHTSRYSPSGSCSRRRSSSSLTVCCGWPLIQVAFAISPCLWPRPRVEGTPMLGECALRPFCTEDIVSKRRSKNGAPVMEVEDMILISVDDHVVEPPHVFNGRLPKRFADRAPRIEQTARGDEVWVFDGQTIPNIGLNAVSGRPKEEYGVNPTAYAEMRPGCFDVDERVKDMSAAGVLASMCFPSFPSFSGRIFLGCEDKELAAAVVSAYNDWHID